MPYRGVELGFLDELTEQVNVVLVAEILNISI